MMDGKPYLIPESWTKSSIGKIVVKAKQRDPRKKPDEVFQYADVSSVSNVSFKITSTTPTLGSDAPSRARKAIETDDVLFATVRPALKRIALVPPELDGAIVSTAYCVLRCDKAIAEPRFLYYFLITDHFNARMVNLERGASYPAVRDSDVTASWFPLPPLPEQKKIVHILSTVQRVIETQERLIRTTTELKKALMHKLFTEGLHNEPKKQTEIGPIPESWEVVLLSDLIGISHGHAFKGKFFTTEGPTVLTPGNFKLDGGLYWGRRTKYTSETYDDSAVLNPGDLVVVMTDLTPTAKLLGGPAFVPQGRTILHNQRIGKILSISPNATPKFLYWLFLSHAFKRYMRLTATGSTVRHTSPTKIKDYTFGLPSLNEQNEIVEMLAQADLKIASAGQKSHALQDLFRTLLHKLMTAKTRVHELELPI